MHNRLLVDQPVSYCHFVMGSILQPTIFYVISIRTLFSSEKAFNTLCIPFIIVMFSLAVVVIADVLAV